MAVISGPAQSVQDHTWVKGINGLHPLTDIPDGQVADMTNMSANRAGELIGRPACVTQAGVFPIRVANISADSAGKVTLTLDGLDVNSQLLTQPKQPVIVRGRTYQPGALNPLPWSAAYPNYIERWFATQAVPDVVSLAANSSTTLTGLPAGCLSVPSILDVTNTSAIPDSAQIHLATGDLTVTVTDVDPAIAPLQVAAIPISNYPGAFTHNFTFVGSSSNQSVTIPASTHGITYAPHGLCLWVFRLGMTTADLIIPDIARYDTALSVTIGGVDLIGADYTLVIAPACDSTQDTLTYTTTVAVPVTAAGSIATAQCYYRDPATTQWTLVEPDSLQRDGASLIATLHNGTGLPSADLRVQAFESTAIYNRITLQLDASDLPVSAYSESSPDMCVYGLNPAELGGGGGGFPYLLDCLRAELQETPLISHERNFYSAGTLSRMWPLALSATIAGTGTTHIGPAFSDVATLRTAGNYIHSSFTDNRAPFTITGAAANQVTLHIACPAYVNTGVHPILSADSVVISECGVSLLNGEFVVNTSYDGDDQALSIIIDLPSDISSQILSFNDLLGRKGMLFADTSRVPVLAQASYPFVIGDALEYGGDIELDYLGFAPDTASLLVRSQVPVSIPAGRILSVARSYRTVLPFVAHTFVPGDSVYLASAPREARQVMSCDVTTVTLSEPVLVQYADQLICPRKWEQLDLQHPAPGTRAPGRQLHALAELQPLVSGALNGSLYVASPNNYPVGITDAGIHSMGLPEWDPIHCIALENAPNPIVSKQVDIPVISRAGMVYHVASGDEAKAQQDNLYLVYDNGAGYNIGVVVIAKEVVNSTANNYVVGQIAVRLISGSLGVVSGSNLTLRKAYRVRYTARLRYTDENGRPVVGTSGGYEDASVIISGNEVPILTLIEPPHVGWRDYARGVYIDIFRTVIGDLMEGGVQNPASLQVYKKLATLPCDFTTNQGYQTYRDLSPDECLGSTDTDTLQLVNSLSPGVNRGNGIQPMPRHKTITTMGARTMVGNITGDLGCSLTFLSMAATTPADIMNSVITLTPSVGAPQVYEFTSYSNVSSAQHLQRVSNQIKVPYTGTVVAGNWVFIGMIPELPDPALVTCASGLYRVQSVNGTYAYVNSVGTAGILGLCQFAWASDRSRIPVPLDYQAGGIAVYWHCFGTEGSHSTLGIPDLVAQQASKRLALCIAAANTQLNPTQPFYARGGTSQSLDDYGGKLRIWCPPPMNPDALAASISVTFTGGLKMALNDDLISTGVSYPMIERRWPSRLLVSGRNFPESVVNYHQETGFSVIDVNPSDGDEIVAIRAFMSVSVYTASQQQQQLLVFKRRSVYSISIDAFVLGQPTYTQQVVTSGHGASTATGIAYADFAVIFASHDGILRLKKDYTLDHLGLQIGRQLKEANFANAALYGGHTDVNAYLTSDNYVWQYIPEYDSWSKWTLPASIGGLCSQNAQMLAAVPGRVYLLDEEGGALDDGVPYRQEVQFRPTHGGDPSILKQGSFIFVNAGMADWEAGSQEQLNVEYATEMLPTWLPCPTATQLGPVTDNDLNSEVTPMRTVLRFGCPAKRFQILQIRAWADRGQRLSLSSVIYKLRLLDQGGAGAGTSG